MDVRETIKDIKGQFRLFMKKIMKWRKLYGKKISVNVKF